MNEKTHLWRGKCYYQGSQECKGSIKHTNQDVDSKIIAVAWKASFIENGNFLMPLAPPTQPDITASVQDGPDSLNQQNDDHEGVPSIVPGKRFVKTESNLSL